jgi:uncharacterized membrane protein
MKSRLSTYVSVVAFSAAIAAAQGPTFTAIDFPGAASTQSWGINASGSIVGFYVNADKTTHGFLLSAGQFSAIDFPGAAFSEANGINSRGDIVGDYAVTATGSGPHHGFLLSRDGIFTSIDFPGANSTVAIGNNSRGDILGSYSLDDGVNHSFVLSEGHFSTIDLPGGTPIVANGMNPQGDLVGGYTSGGIGHGLLFSEGDFTQFDLPGATFTTATGVNSHGDIVGRYTASGVNHAFLLSAGRFNRLDFPGAIYTGATAINQRGDILGRYRNADNVFHGFLIAGFQPVCAIRMPPPQIAVTAGGAAVTHSSDFSLVTTSKPATVGEVLSIFATGLGTTFPTAASGQPFPSSPLSVVDSLVEVRVNGRSAIVLGAYGLPGTVDGYQVNFRLQNDTAKGSASIELSAAGVAGAPVKIMIQ